MSEPGPVALMRSLVLIDAAFDDSLLLNENEMRLCSMSRTSKPSPVLLLLVKCLVAFRQDQKNLSSLNP